MERAVVTLGRNVLGDLPDETRVVLRYGDVWDFAAGAGTFAHNTFRLNSLYDPDQTGVGGVPSGFATWCSATGLYTHYEVEAVDVTARFINTHATQTILVGLLPELNNSAAPGTGAQYQQTALEKGYPFAFLNSLPYEGCTTTLRMRTSIAKLLGRDMARSRDNSADYNANPAVACNLDVYAVNADGATIGCTARVVFSIEYTIRFSQRQIAVVD